MKYQNVAIVYVSSPLGDLYQTHQLVIETEEIRKRDYKGISETFELGESPLECALRGIREELSLIKDNNNLRFKEIKEVVKTSSSTNKLKTYNFYIYEMNIDKAEAESIDLKIHEDDVYTYFEWR